MTSDQLQLNLMYLTLFCFGMLIIQFIIRTIKIIRNKKIEGSEDIMCVIFWIAFLLPITLAYLYIKKTFKKEKQTEIKKDNNGIEDLYKM